MSSDAPSSVDQRRRQSDDGLGLSSPGFAVSRQRRILELLDASQEIQVATLSQELDVSQETVRRDLRALETEGKLTRVHGGAIAFKDPVVKPLDERAAELSPQKEAIAELVLDMDLIAEGQCIFLGGGSTTLPLARLLANHVPARYVTNTIDIALALARSGRHEVTLTGGRVNAQHELLSGPQTVESVGRYVFDLTISGTNAVDLKLGFLDLFESEATVHRMLVHQSARYVVLADHTKFGRTASFCALPMNAADVLISDREPPPAFLAALKDAQVRIAWPGYDRRTSF